MTDPQRLEALRAILREASAEGFAGVEAEGLGPRLREATDALGESGVPDPYDAQLRHFRTGLNRFEERGRQDRSAVVAHGMRICMSLAQPAEPPKKRARKPKLGRAGDDARKPASPPTSDLTRLPGVGPKTADKLAGRGLASLEDLAFMLPLGYEDRRNTSTLDEVEEGDSVVVEATITGFRQGWFRRRYNATLKLEQETPSGPIAFDAKWFHPVGGLGNRVEAGQSVALAGRVKRFRGRWSMVHPEILESDERDRGIAVRYPVVEGVSQKTLRKLCHAALDLLLEQGLAEVLPPELIAEHSLPPLGEALAHLHRPSDELDDEELEALVEKRSAAHRRLAFEEFFVLQLAVLRRRAEEQATVGAHAVVVDAIDREELRGCLPFEPTAAQWRALGELEGDMGDPSGRPMLRLLQGDVGSGKTVVAFAAAKAVARAGGQSALMAPTEILAEQHLRTLQPWCERAGLRVALLTGSTGRAQRTSLLSLLAAGQIDVLVGTHALLVGDVHFSQLGLVVVDEQHRFGVNQRNTLREKGAAPHLLVMTATPIPRSLALTAYGELEASVIDELPPGREPPRTKLFAGKNKLDAARDELAGYVREGARAYVVCPLVESSDAVDASHVEETAAAIRQRLPDTAVGVVHGRMKGEEKDRLLRAFAEGETDVLVATTVIEVGVDVPDATAILVEHAERFGLAQLHQLRGRVGRGDASKGASMCLLHTASAKSSDTGRRLKVLVDHTDGFLIAERDLELRGPGEVFGTRQSGVPRLRYAGFSGEGLKLLVTARDAASELLGADPDLGAHPDLAARLEQRIAESRIVAGESG